MAAPVRANFSDLCRALTTQLSGTTEIWGQNQLIDGFGDGFGHAVTPPVAVQLPVLIAAAIADLVFEDPTFQDVDFPSDCPASRTIVLSPLLSLELQRLIQQKGGTLKLGSSGTYVFDTPKDALRFKHLISASEEYAPVVGRVECILLRPLYLNKIRAALETYLAANNRRTNFVLDTSVETECTGAVIGSQLDIVKRMIKHCNNILETSGNRGLINDLEEYFDSVNLTLWWKEVTSRLLRAAAHLDTLPATGNAGNRNILLQAFVYEGPVDEASRVPVTSDKRFFNPWYVLTGLLAALIAMAVALMVKNHQNHVQFEADNEISIETAYEYQSSLAQLARTARTGSLNSAFELSISMAQTAHFTPHVCSDSLDASIRFTSEHHNASLHHDPSWYYITAKTRNENLVWSYRLGVYMYQVYYVLAINDADLQRKLMRTVEDVRPRCFNPLTVYSPAVVQQDIRIDATPALLETMLSNLELHAEGIASKLPKKFPYF